MENQEPVSSISHIGVKKPEESLPKADDATTGKDTLLNKKKGKKVDVYQKDEQG